MATHLRPYKIVIVTILQEVDEDDNVVGEKETNPLVFFSSEKAAEWLGQLDEQTAALSKVGSNGGRASVPVN